MARKIDRFSDCLIHRSATAHTSALLHASVVVNLIAPAWACSSVKLRAWKKVFKIIFICYLFLSIDRNRTWQSRSKMWSVLLTFNELYESSNSTLDWCSWRCRINKKWKWKRFFMQAPQRKGKFGRYVNFFMRTFDFVISFRHTFVELWPADAQKATIQLWNSKKVTLNSHQ